MKMKMGYEGLHLSANQPTQATDDTRMMYGFDRGRWSTLLIS
jgi:hypothetical protein